MRTIGRRWPEGIGPDRQAMCSYCGVQWRRSQLTRDASQNLACPDCAPGLDIVSLTEGNARLMRSRQPKTVGPADGNFDQFICPPSPGFVDPNGPPPRPINHGPLGPMSVVVNMWLRADVVQQGTAPGRVSLWTDQSTRNNHLPALTPSAEPTYVPSDATLNNMPTVYADGATQFLQQVAFKGGAPMWGWVIFFQGTSSSATTLIGAGVGLQQGVTAGTMRLLTNGGVQSECGGGSIGAWSRGILSFNVSGFDTLQIGSVSVSDASAGQRFGSAVSLFSGFNGASKFNGAAAELLLTNGPPTAGEIAAIEAYGVARYGGAPFA